MWTLLLICIVDEYSLSEVSLKKMACATDGVVRSMSMPSSSPIDVRIRICKHQQVIWAMCKLLLMCKVDEYRENILCVQSKRRRKM